MTGPVARWREKQAVLCRWQESETHVGELVLVHVDALFDSLVELDSVAVIWKKERPARQYRSRSRARERARRD